MTFSAADRLKTVWQALEDQGAVVHRVNAAHLSDAAVRKLLQQEERRLRILAEADSPGPGRVPRPWPSRSLTPKGTTDE